MPQRTFTSSPTYQKGIYDCHTLIFYSINIKSSLKNKIKDRTRVHQCKLTTDNLYRPIMEYNEKKSQNYDLILELFLPNK
ncbi:hypothetical protein FAJ36_05040 [Streptococcus suis]|uniref:Uncharacterized protein n=1 Tax=Streptococcus suis TaxID=1307 RepID=A0A4T2H0I2_STRSU|nr:hypothetical protein FAJ36_06210 [Streptococcus suis]TII05610.1 hypothetical protein FAJ36_05040 [Streptococcus suis]